MIPSDAEPTSADGLIVVVLSCDRPGFFAEMLRSLEAQHGGCATVLVSDDSTDDTIADLCRASAMDVHYQSGPRAGQAANLRSALVHPLAVRSTHVSILHDDDWWDPPFIERSRQAFAADPDLDAFFVGVRYVDGSGTTLESDTNTRQTTRRRLMPAGSLRLEDARQRGAAILGDGLLSPFLATFTRRSLFDTWLAAPSWGDFDDLWMLSHFAKVPLRIAFDDELLCNYRIHRSSIASSSGDHMEVPIQLLEQLRRDPELAVIDDVLAARIRDRCLQAAIVAVGKGERARARALLRRPSRSVWSVREGLLMLATFVPSSGVIRAYLRTRSDRFG